MTVPDYFTRWIDEQDGEPTGTGVVLSFVRTLNRSDWLDLLSDVLSNSERASIVLQPSRGGSLQERLCYLLEEMDPETRGVAIGSIAGRLHEELYAVEGSRGEAAEVPVRRAERLLELLSIGVPPEERPWIQRLVNIEEYGTSIAIAAAECIVDDEEVPISFWEEHANSMEVELASCALTALSYRNVLRFWPALAASKGDDSGALTIDTALAHAIARSDGDVFAEKGMRLALNGASPGIRRLIEENARRIRRFHLIGAQPRDVTDSAWEGLAVGAFLDDGRVVLPAHAAPENLLSNVGDGKDVDYFVGTVRSARFISGGTRRFQERVVSLVERYTKPSWGRLERDDFSKLLEDGSFSRDGYLLPFAYFQLGDLRENRWGVITYGRQRTIGLILCRENPLLQRILDICPRDKKRALPGMERALELEPWAEDEAKESWAFIASLVRPALRSGIVRYEVGYIFADVILACLEHLGENELRRQFKANAEAAAGEPRSRHYWWYRSPEAAGDTQSVYLIDPSELRGCILGEDYHAIVIPHFLDIPVGVGFNWPMAQILESSRAWEPIRDGIGELLSDSPERMELNASGIDIVEDDRSEDRRVGVDRSVLSYSAGRSKKKRL